MDVKTCYSTIANDFSLTRFSVWNSVKKFLDQLPFGSLVGDIGCGNGKNMLYRKDELQYLGTDFCPEFVDICKKRNLDVIEGNILDIPYKDNYFDHLICIAVIHHLEKQSDRIKAIDELLRICKSNGKILIYVWSFNQYEESKRKFINKEEMISFRNKLGNITYRYYYLYTMDELINDINSLKNKYNFSIEESFNEKNNECVIIKKL